MFALIVRDDLNCTHSPFETGNEPRIIPILSPPLELQNPSTKKNRKIFFKHNKIKWRWKNQDRKTAGSVSHQSHHCHSYLLHHSTGSCRPQARSRLAFDRQNDRKVQHQRDCQSLQSLADFAPLFTENADDKRASWVRQPLFKRIDAIVNFLYYIDSWRPIYRVETHRDRALR